jgi:hypothetical protein
MSGHWQKLKDEIEQERQRMTALRNDMTPLSRDFVESAKTILAQHGLPDDVQEKKLKNLENALKALTKN